LKKVDFTLDSLLESIEIKGLIYKKVKDVVGLYYAVIVLLNMKDGGKINGRN